MVRVALFSTQGAEGSTRFSFWQLTVVSESMASIVDGMMIFFMAVVFDWFLIPFD